MDKKKAEAIVKNAIGTDYSLSLIRNNGSIYVFKCESKHVMPSIIIAAVNVNTNKIGTSMLSVDEAVSFVR